MLNVLALGTTVVALTIAGASDLVRYEIPNELSAALLLAFALAFLGNPSAEAAWNITAGIAVFGAMAVLFAAGLCGGGDVKLLAATSVWMGWHNLLPFLLLTAICGAAVALLLLAARRFKTARPAPAHPARARWYDRLLSTDEGVPYGVAIAAAGITLLSLTDVSSILSSIAN